MEFVNRDQQATNRDRAREREREREESVQGKRSSHGGKQRKAEARIAREVQIFVFTLAAGWFIL
jgi:hypothetical protein